MTIPVALKRLLVVCSGCVTGLSELPQMVARKGLISRNPFQMPYQLLTFIQMHTEWLGSTSQLLGNGQDRAQIVILVCLRLGQSIYPSAYFMRG